MLVGRCSWELSGRKLHRKTKKSQTSSEAEGSAVPRTSPGNAEYYTQNKIVISTGGVIGLRSTQGDEKRLGPATTFHVIATLSFVIPSEAEGPAVPRTFPGNVFRRYAGPLATG